MKKSELQKKLMKNSARMIKKSVLQVEESTLIPKCVGILYQPNRPKSLKK